MTAMAPVNDRSVIALVLRKVPDTPYDLDKWRTVAQPYREKKAIKRSQLRCEGCALLCEKLIAATGDGL